MNPELEFLGELEKKRPVGLHPNTLKDSRKYDNRLRTRNATTVYRELAPRVGKTEIEPVLLREQPSTPFTLSWHSTCGNIRCEDGSGISLSSPWRLGSASNLNCNTRYCSTTFGGLGQFAIRLSFYSFLTKI